MKGSYWAMMLSKLNKQRSEEKDIVISIGIDNDNNIILIYNFKNLNQFDDETINAFLEHECHHIFNKHFLRECNLKSREDILDRDIYSIACDLAINTNIGKMPKTIILNDKIRELIFPDIYGFDENLITEDYYHELKKLKEEEILKNFSEEHNDSDDESDSDESQNNENKSSSDSQENSDENESESGDSSQENSQESKSNSQQDSDESQNNENESKSDDNHPRTDTQKYKFDDINESSNNGTETNEKIDSKQLNKKVSSNLKNQFAHKNWQPINDDPNNEFIIDNNIRTLVGNTTKEYHQSFGKLPGNFEEMIEKILEVPKLPYYAIIKRYIIGSRIGKYKFSYSKINRKRMFIFSDDDEIEKNFKTVCPFPGKQIDKTFDIGILLDTSASIPLTDDGIYEALKGVESIMKNDKNTKITLIQNDTKIVEEKEIKKIEDIHRLTIQGRGGTNLLPGLHRFKELKNDVTIVFTDGYFKSLKDKVYSLPKKIIWVLPEKYSTTEYIGNIGVVVHFPIKG
jgi:predicted metal-dependent peptidase